MKPPDAEDPAHLDGGAEDERYLVELAEEALAGLRELGAALIVGQTDLDAALGIPAPEFAEHLAKQDGPGPSCD
ncbi:hypothetical protein [Variovorax sp. Sphag1AA]|uniref:hypothetical protein n=1 Tax=Variovorax sp. Sphag1AA TaxID=2587027 RepID=UPI001608DFCE|nr:hypothetical protein [Variovorax sp. Sphag1AA]MBB3181155.1 hypothetical protein [Variovorax sp. Sphag1AA]